MSASYRRFEILLPRRYNDGEPVPDELIADALFSIQKRFGAVSSETQTIHGLWSHEDQTYRDDLVRLFADVPDTPESRQLFLEFKERAKATFRQIDIWMTTYPVDIL